MNPEPQQPAEAPQPPMSGAPAGRPESQEPKTSGSLKWLMIGLAVVIIVAVVYILVK